MASYFSESVIRTVNRLTNQSQMSCHEFGMTFDFTEVKVRCNDLKCRPFQMKEEIKFCPRA